MDIKLLVVNQQQEIFDYFSPFFIKEGCREVRWYGVLFTCMSSYAVCIETSKHTGNRLLHKFTLPSTS